MKNTVRHSLVLLLSLSLAGSFAGCSSKDSAKKVDVSAQITALKSEDKNARVDAAIALASVGEKAVPAVPALIETLKDKDPEVRRLAAYALQEIGFKASQAIPAVRELMQRETIRDVQTQLVNTLRAIDPSASGLKNVNVNTP